MSVGAAYLEPWLYCWGSRSRLPYWAMLWWQACAWAACACAACAQEPQCAAAACGTQGSAAQPVSVAVPYKSLTCRDNDRERQREGDRMERLSVDCELQLIQKTLPEPRTCNRIGLTECPQVAQVHRITRRLSVLGFLARNCGTYCS